MRVRRRLPELSASGGRRRNYSALIFPQESNLRVVDIFPISKPQCSPKKLPSISSFTAMTKRYDHANEEQRYKEEVKSQEKRGRVVFE
jgi:hypothetical protein